MRKLGLLFIFLLLFSFTCSAVSPAKISIIATKKLYKLKEPVICKMFFKNTSENNLKINSRFLLNYHVYSEQEVVFYITGPDGKEVEFLPIVFAGMPGKWFFKTLKPGKYVGKKYNLSKYFKFNKKGKYEMYARYENRYKFDKKSPAWVGTVDSNTVEFEIK